MGLQIREFTSDSGQIYIRRGLGAPATETLLFVQPTAPDTGSIVDLSPMNRSVQGAFDTSSMPPNQHWNGWYMVPRATIGATELNVTTSPEDFQLGTSNFTVEMVVNGILPNVDGLGRICGSDHGQQPTGWNISFDGNNAQPTGVSVNGIFSIPFSFATNTRYHIALCRDANLFTLFVNGVNVGSVNSSVSLTGVPTNFRCFHRADAYNLFNNQLVANIESFRIVKDVALYSQNFIADLTKPMYLY